MILPLLLLPLSSLTSARYALFRNATVPPPQQLAHTSLTNSYLARPPPKAPADCPPCFNCLLPAFKCLQYGECREFDGMCKCPEGWGGEDCSTPLCGSLAEGRDRYPRQGDDCQCTEGWTGLNCNGKEKFSRMVGFVDQEDTLMGTLTVYETVLYSALLRLPRGMSLEAKQIRTLETLHELGILGIRDSRIGETGQRAISGGEKRRVSIACELVTSPSILMLDEPTSGLDSFNALNVVECLVTLAKKYNRTVIFTIHQPRSNIVAMFDQLVLMAKGRVVYSGEFSRCQDYFERIGYPCPAGFNIADYLIDLTMQEEMEGKTHSEPELSALINELPSSRASYSDEESGAGNGGESSGTAVSGSASDRDDNESRRSISEEPSNTVRSRKFFSLGRKSKKPKAELSDRMKDLFSSYERSIIAKDIQEEIENSKRITRRESFDEDTKDGKVWRRASLWTQFRILSGRAFKNLYRNPGLMLTQYLISVILALICSFLFRNLTEDIPGFQNRMGLFFFILALFGFSCLTSLRTFANERILFMRERANGYYSPVTYFTAKVLFDLLPLRIVPPFILGAIIYKPVGLVPTVAEFWKFILVLVLFNLVASSSVMLIGIAVKNESVASLIGTLSMLFNLLFAGLLINSEKMPHGFGWLQTVSYFHAGMEGLLVNELRYLHLRDHRYGVDIEVPAATILSMFGFNAQAFWFPDTTVLAVFFAGFTLASFLALVFLVKERR
ncbi:hypothetical protein BT69DRAFT_1279899 [Atractiella rhizophila]|nr:hypothetical protein BT69DRAFT_1279899 [Atractiella rhizophila]